MLKNTRLSFILCWISLFYCQVSTSSPPTPVDLFQFAIYWTQTDVPLGTDTEDFTPPDLLCLLSGDCETGPGGIWFIDNSRPTNGDGTLANPFNSFAPVNAPDGTGDADAPGDLLYVLQGNAPYTVRVELEANQQLVGQGVDLVVNNQTLVEGSPEQIPTLNNIGSGTDVVTLANDCQVRGITIDLDGEDGISGVSVVGAVVQDVTITRSGGDPAGIFFMDTPSGTFEIRRVSIAGTGRGIEIRDCEGVFAIQDSMVSDPTDPALQVRGGSANIVVSGETRLQRDGPVVSFTSHSGDATFGETVEIVGSSLSFSGANGRYLFHSDIQFTGTRAGVSVRSNSTGDIHFDRFKAIQMPGSLFPQGMVSVQGGSANLTFDTIDLTQNSGAPLFQIDFDHLGSVTVASSSESIIRSTTGTGMQFDGANGFYRFLCPVDLQGGDSGIDIKGSSGQFTFADVAIDNPSGGNGVDISGSQTAGEIVDVTFENLDIATQGGTGFRVREAGFLNLPETGQCEVSTMGERAIDLSFASGQIFFDSAIGTNSPSAPVSILDFNGFVQILGGDLSTLGENSSGLFASQTSGSVTCLDLSGLTIGSGVNADDISLNQSSGTLSISQESETDLSQENNSATVASSGVIAYSCGL
ncbi:MAG: hypothetical protein H6751_12200 [Candidatus Omnitrophica bacterium]|nr:hypothetical protein [Candidatus Omnitrophota bacterium]